MNQEQFQTGKRICEFGRIFADQILKCLRDSGLDDLGYGIVVDINRPVVIGESVLISDVRLTKPGDSYTKDFCYHKYLAKGWETMYEPAVLHDDVRKVQPDHGYPKSRTEKEKTAELDCDPTYFGDDPDTLVGWWGLT